jgi:hypothetical protein
MAYLIRSTLAELPYSYKAIQTNASVLNVLKYLKQDVNNGEGFPELYGDYSADENTLLIETADGIVCYEFKEDKTTRCLLAKTDAKIIDRTEWVTKKVKIQWKLRQKDNLNALEIQTHLEHEIGNVTEKKMANSYLYFVGANKGLLK